MTGWISLHRSIQEHWLFKEKRKFSRFEAWVDLLLLVNHKSKKTMIDGELITVKRGQRITSLRKLGERWNWSRTKVEKFLKVLEKEKMLVVKKDSKKTVLTVVKYDDYQNEELEKRHRNDSEVTVKRQSNDTEMTLKNTNNNDNNDNNENNVNNDNNVVVVDDNKTDFKSVFNLYQENIEYTPSPLTIDKFQQDFDQYGSELMTYAIEKSALNNNHNYRFIDYLLKDWSKRNLKSKAAIEQYEQQLQEIKNKKSSPNLVSKEITPEWLKNGREQTESIKDDQIYLKQKERENEAMRRQREVFEKRLKENWGD